jgi:two-component system sensor histidine kinase BaeS
MNDRRPQFSERPAPPRDPRGNRPFSPMGGPPWGGGRPPWAKKGRGRFLFFRIALIFGIITILIAAWMGLLAFLITRVMGGTVHTARAIWVSGGVLLLLIPLLAGTAGRFAFRRFAMPLAEVMDAAEAVTRGDLTVRVAAHERRGEVNRLGDTFNRMVTELERADRHRRNMTADIAHELRTPLHVIQGNLEGILDGVYEPTAEHITATLSETRILARLVEDLRTLSLAESDQLPLAREEVDINDLIADVVTGFSGQAEANHITLHAAIPEDTHRLTIKGDAGRLDQVLSNLVANALRHTPTNGTITVQAQPLPKGVRLTVKDTGEGIPAADLPYIFDRFWRGDAARSRTEGGSSGLGLAIARQLVQAHGGQIEVASVVGQGTTFIIELPLMGRE